MSDRAEPVVGHWDLSDDGGTLVHTDGSVVGFEDVSLDAMVELIAAVDARPAPSAPAEPTVPEQLARATKIPDGAELLGMIVLRDGDGISTVTATRETGLFVVRQDGVPVTEFGHPDASYTKAEWAIHRMVTYCGWPLS